jgi:hypothetical protein
VDVLRQQLISRGAKIAVGEGKEPEVETTRQLLPMYVTDSSICQLSMSALGEGHTNSRPPGSSTTITPYTDPVSSEESTMLVISMTPTKSVVHCRPKYTT